MNRASVDITGAGNHTVVAGVAGQSILVHETLLTFSHASTEALRVWFKADSEIKAGPFFVTDGGKVRYENKDGARRYLGPPGAALVLELDDGLSCAGDIYYEMGAV